MSKDRQDPQTESAREAAGELPRIDLSTFVLSLSTSALYNLGLVESPDVGLVEEPNRALAKQTIDTLEMLREKTRGNLDETETRLFDSLLYELRMRFVSSEPDAGR